MSISLDNAIWLTYICTEVVVLALLLVRRIYRTLPVFCLYLIWDLLSNLGAFLVNRYAPDSYFTVYAAETIIDSVFQFCILVELTWSILRPLRASLSLKSLIIVGTVILVAGAAIWPFAALHSIQAAERALLLAQLHQTMAILRILFFVLLAVSSQWLSISWRDRELQVATGLGFYALASVGVSFLETHQNSGSQFSGLFQFEVVAFICSLLYWLFSFSQQEAQRREFTPQMQRVLLAVAGAARTTRISLADTHDGKPRK